MVTAVGVVPDTYSETVSVARVPASTQDDGLGLRLYVGPGPSHCKQTVHLEPNQVPVAYQDCLIVYIDSSKKRYISRTFYDSRLRPTQFGETLVRRELVTQKSHISCVDHRPNTQRKWFKSAVNLTPKVFSSHASLRLDKGAFLKATDDVTEEYEVTKVTGGVKVTSRDTRLEELVKRKAQKEAEVPSYKTGPLIVDTSERKSVNNNDDLEENNNYVNGLNGDIYDEDEDIYDDFIRDNDIYQTRQFNGWHEKETNGW